MPRPKLTHCVHGHERTPENIIGTNCGTCMREQKRAFRKEHPDKHREDQKIYRGKNPEKLKAKNHRRRTLKTQAGGSFTAEEWRALCKFYDYRCLCCNRRVKLTADHVIPISKGGTSNIENIQPLCMPCNGRKRTGTTDFRLRRLRK